MCNKKKIGMTLYQTHAFRMTKFGTSFTKFGASFIKFGTSDPIVFWVLHLNMDGPWFHFGTHKEVIGGRSPHQNALWNAWYILHKIWYIIHKIWYRSYCFRVPHLNIDDTWFHFGTHKKVIGGRSPPRNALWNTWYILYKFWYILYKFWYILH